MDIGLLLELKGIGVGVGAIFDVWADSGTVVALERRSGAMVDGLVETVAQAGVRGEVGTGDWAWAEARVYFRA